MQVSYFSLGAVLMGPPSTGPSAQDHGNIMIHQHQQNILRRVAWKAKLMLDRIVADHLLQSGLGYWIYSAHQKLSVGVNFHTTLGDGSKSTLVAASLTSLPALVSP